MNRLVLSVFLVYLNFSAFSQTGPGGISTTDIAFWLRADLGITLSGSDVDSWADQSGNGLSAAPGTAPELITSSSGLNNQPAIEFLNENLLIGNSGLINVGNQTTKTMFLVFNAPSTVVNGQEVLYEQGGGTNGLIFYIEGDGASMDLHMGVYTGSGTNYNFESFTISTSTTYIVAMTYDAASLEGYSANSTAGLTSAIATPSGDPINPLLEHTGDIRLGMNIAVNRGVGAVEVSVNSDFTGQIAEILQYNRVLNAIELDAVSNYLSAKYDIAITNDQYDGDTGGSGDFDYDVTMVGNDGTNSQTSATGGLVTMTEATIGTGEYLVWGHNNAVATDLTGDYNGLTNNGSARIWAVEETGAVGTVSISVAAVDLSSATKIIIDNNADLSSPEQVLSLTVGTNLTVDVDFTDNAVSYFSFTGDPEIALSGNAVDIVNNDATPSVADSTDFGSLDLSAGSNTNTFTINNQGGALLNISSIGISGTNAADFALGATPASVAGLSSETFDITFNPSGLGIRTATVSIDSDDSDEDPFEFDIQGTGVNVSEITITGNSVEIVDGKTTTSTSDHTYFGNTVGTALERTYTIMNDGTADLTGISASASGSDFSVSVSPAASLTSGNSTTFTVSFLPAARSSSITATVTVNSNDPDEGTYTFDVEGSSLEGPGGLSSNLNLWFKGDDGVTGTTPITAWTDQSGSGYDITGNASAPDLLTNEINNNPAITFDGTTNYLPLTKNFNNEGIDKVIVFTVFKTDFPGVSYNDNWAFLDFDRSDFFSFNIRGDGDLGFSYRGTVTQDAKTISQGLNDDVPHIGLAIYDNSVTIDTRIRVDGLEGALEAGTEPTYAASNGDIEATSQTIGAATTRYGFIGDGSEAITEDGDRNNIYYDGEIAEVIYYEGQSITETEIKQIETYLAIKYGITLSNDSDGDATAFEAGEGDYIYEDGFGASMTIWDADVNQTFHHDVAGIGRDDNSTLSQATSLSENASAILTVTNSGALVDGEFLIWGHNDGTSTDLTGSYNGGTNNGSARIWAIQETGDMGTVSLSFPAASLPGVDYIVVDGNNDLSSPEQIIAVTTGANVTVDVDFAGNSTSYFGFIQEPEISVTGNSVEIADGETAFGLNDDREFSAQDVGAGSETNTFTVNNLGNAELTISSIVLSNTADFSIISSPSSVAALSSATLEIQFDPASIGTLSSTVTINSNDEDEAAFDFTIQGEGAALAEIQVSGNATNIADGDTTPSAADDTFFGNSVTDNIEKTFTISNDAGAGSNLTITTPLSISGSARFTVVAQPGTSVAPGGSTTFTVRYTPSGISTSEVATISIANDDTDENPYDFNVEASSFPVPGGVDNDLTLWFKADEGVESSNGVTANNSDPVEYWRDQSPNANDAIESDLAERPTWDNTNTINGNPVMTFDGNNRMAISNVVYNDAATLDQMTIYAIAQTTNDAENIIVSFDRSSFFRFSVNNVNNFRLGSHQSGLTTDFSSTGASAGNGAPHIIGADFDGVTTGDQRLFYDGALNSTLNTGAGFLGNTGELPRFGFISENSEATTFDGVNNNNERFVGDIAEIIYFESTLSETERQQVESYLALKYGLTLSTDTDGDATALEAGEGDYLDADGNVVWDADVSATYHNQIAGIANDADAGLNQSASQSILSGSILNMSDAALSNKDYIVWGHNGSSVNGQASTNSSYRTALQRVWKVEISGSTTNIDNLSFDLNHFSVAPALASDIALLIDDNETFTSPTEVVASSWTSNVASFDNVDFSAFGGDIYITVAYNLPVPGGVSNNLTVWYKADQGVEEADGDPVENVDYVQYWRDQSGNSYDGQQNITENRPRYDETNTFNFNPVLGFESASRMTINNLFYDLTTNTLDNVDVYAVTKSSQTDEGIIMSFDRSSFFRIALNMNDIANFGLGTTTAGGLDDINASASASDGEAHLIQGSYNGATGQKDLYLDGANVGSASATHGAGTMGNASEVPRWGYINANSEETSFSADGAGSDGGFLGEIAEIVYFESALGATEKGQVESYLAVKYGITLSGNYIASDGTTTVWDNAANTGYNNRIAAVALDNTGSLDQPQSRSENSEAILTIANSGLSDGDYIFFGNDGADLSIVTSGSGSLDGRYNRIWKFQVTGASNTADLSFDLSSIAIKPTLLNSYRLLLDDNASFTSPQEISAATLTNDVLAFTSVNLSGETYMALALDPDLDNDGIADADDIDDDNDGLLDVDEGNGAVDTDMDGIADSRDLDSDNDGIGDLYESGAEGAGTALVSLDADNDGIIDAGNVGTNGFDDRLETAVDNGTLAYTISDSDGEGVLDYKDLDSDNNGISDLVESGRNSTVDSDDDGVFEGDDADEDGVPDEIDSDATTFGSELNALDTDTDGTPDFRDLDNDADGTEDVDAVGLADTTPDDGRLDGTTDADGDGVWSLRDDDDVTFGFINNSDLVTGSGTDWYSYTSGDWTDSDNWTTDPSGSTRINPTATYPKNFDENVTILNGDEMVMDFDGLILSSVTINNGGIIDLGMTQNHNFTAINGDGTIRLASDDFPGGDATNFVSASGGTVIFTDQNPAVDYELTTNREFNNVIVDLAANTLVLKADYTLNADLTIASGTLQINDNTTDGFTDNTTPLNITVNGNLTVDAGSAITVGNVDASTEVGTSSGIFTFHQLEVLGDLTNNGSIVLTNLGTTSIADGRYRDKYPTADDFDNITGTNDIPADEFGVAELLFTNGTADQLVTLNGTTDLYRIEVAKGTSQTYMVEINASTTSNFRLLGRIAMSQSDNSADNPNIDNPRALGLEAGILKLGDNIEIVQIAKEDANGSVARTQDGNRNYMIDLDAQLWLASNSSITKENDWGIHPFGKLKVTDNATLTFTGVGLQRTILVDNQGVYEQTGGTVNVTQFRNKTGADGAPRGSFIMTGGTMNVGNGGSSDGSHGIFSVPWQDQNFILKAADLANPPVINIILDGNRGKDNAAIQIGVKDGNYDIGESTINIIHTSDTDYKVVSTAPLYNLSYDGSSSSAELIIDNISDSNGDDIADGGVTSDDNSGGTPSPAEDARPLIIQNDLTITDGRFDANDQNVWVGNILTVESGAEYDPGTNITYLNGDSPVQFVNLSGATPLVGGGFYDLNVSASGTEKTFGGDLSTVVILNDLTIGSGVTFNDNGAVIQVNGDIDNAGIHETDNTSPGRIELTGGAATHTISGDGAGRFKILTLDDATNAITTAADIQIDSVLNLVNGLIDINTNQLIINSTATDPIRDDAGGTTNFSATKMIQTAGNASDGGMSYVFDASVADPGAVLYPIGTNANATARYTPVQVDLSNVLDTGSVAISIADTELLTTDQSGGNILSYYWRSNNDGFATAPTVSYAFNYDESDDDAADEASFVPGKVLDESPFTRSSEIQGNLNATTNTITFDNDGGGGFTLENANYTAGVAARFVGAPTIYYSRRHESSNQQQWENFDAASGTYLNWSLIGHDGVAAASFPGASDVVIIGKGRINDAGDGDSSDDTGFDNENTRHQMVTNGSRTVAEIVFDSNPVATTLGNNLSRIRLNDETYDLTAGKISGHGELMISVTSTDESVVTADLGDFVSADTSSVFYDIRSGGSVVISNLTEFPGIRLFGNDFDPNVSFANDITAASILVDRTSNMELRSNMTVAGDVRLGNNLEGHITFPNDGANYTLSIGGDLLVTSGDPNTINTENAGTDIHRVSVAGNITVDAINAFDFTSATGTQVELELTGTGDHTFSNTTGVDAALYRLIVNKGTDQTSTFTANNTFTLSSSNDGTSKSLELQAGTLILNNASLDLEVNTGNGDFTIPAEAGLTLQAGTVRISATGTGSGNGMRLDGKLTISGGDVILDGGAGADTYIEYGSAGGSEIELTSGNLIVGSQLRRNLFSGDGVLNYTQSGGTALFGVNAAPDDTRGVFEIVNTGVAGTSSFNLSGASTTFAIVNGQASPSLGTLYIGEDVAVNATTDPFIDFGYNGTVAGVLAQNDLNEAYAINAYSALPNIRIDNANYNSPSLDLIIQPLTVTNDLQILNGGTLEANNFDLTVNSGFTNDGTYTPGTNTTTFDGTIQSVDGTTATTFYDLVVNPATSLTLNNSITVNNDLSISSGLLDDNGNTISLIGDLNITTEHVSPGTGGINMDGTSEQIINLPDNEAEIDYLIINNINNVTLADNGGVATILTIDDELAIENGLLQIGDNRVVLDANTAVTSTAGFSAVRMISVNGVKKSDGVQKAFLASTAIPSYVIPVGTPDKYTPVTLDVVDSDDPGAILIKPIDAPHPSADATLTGDPTELDALNYYWVVTTDPTNVTNFIGDITFQYLDSDANNPGQDEADWASVGNYKAARLISPAWSKPPGAVVDATNNTFTFTNTDLGTGGSTTFDGEYTVGNDIPDLLAAYISDGSVDWNTLTGWNVDRDGDGIYDEVGDDAPWDEIPQPGSIVIIDAGDVVTMSAATDDNQNIFNVEIRGTLDVEDSDGHNFGDVSGTGTLRISNATLPGGNYDEFFSTTGGTLELAGNTDYTISPDFANGIRGLVISEGGTKTLPALALSIGADGIIINDGSILDNSTNDNTITTTGDVIINNGTFDMGGADASISAVDFTLTAGTYTSTGALLDFSGDMNLDGGSFSTGSGTITLEGNMSLAVAATFNHNSGTLTADGTLDQTLTGDFSTETFNNLVVNKSSGSLIVNAGSAVTVANILTMTSGNIRTTGATLLLSAGAGSISRTGGIIDGPLQVNLTDMDVFSFPVGKSNTYKPLQIDVQAGSQSTNPLIWEVEYYTGSAASFSSVENTGIDLDAIETNSNADEQVINVNANEYWRVDTGTGSATAEGITLDISNVGVTQSNINDQKLQVMVWDNAAGEWDHLGGTSSGTPAAGNVESTINQGFSEHIFTSGSEDATTLPVELISFSGEASDWLVYLEWSTATEINNDYFEVQRSRDGENFDAIGYVQGSGTTNEIKAYSFVDENPGAGENYYRLKQVDYDGAEELHQVIRVYNDFYGTTFEAYVYPNPANANNMNIRVSTSDDFSPIQVEIVDLFGKVYYRETLRASLNVDKQITTKKHMVPGLYFVVTSQKGNSVRAKLMIIE